jgi:hypothetical protein
MPKSNTDLENARSLLRYGQKLQEGGGALHQALAGKVQLFYSPKQQDDNADAMADDLAGASDEQWLRAGCTVALNIKTGEILRFTDIKVVKGDADIINPELRPAHLAKITKNDLPQAKKKYKDRTKVAQVDPRDLVILQGDNGLKSLHYFSSADPTDTSLTNSYGHNKAIEIIKMLRNLPDDVRPAGISDGRKVVSFDEVLRTEICVAKRWLQKRSINPYATPHTVTDVVVNDVHFERVRTRSTRFRTSELPARFEHNYRVRGTVAFHFKSAGKETAKKSIFARFKGMSKLFGLRKGERQLEKVRFQPLLGPKNLSVVYQPDIRNDPEYFGVRRQTVTKGYEPARKRLVATKIVLSTERPAIDPETLLPNRKTPIRDALAPVRNRLIAGADLVLSGLSYFQPNI